jgi:hypothetical protein
VIASESKKKRILDRLLATKEMRKLAFQPLEFRFAAWCLST